MAIYTRFGTEVRLVAASLLPVWIEDRGGEIKWHLREPTKTKRTKEIAEMPVWFATAIVLDERPDHGPRGRFLHDGKGICINEFVADDGAAEVQRVCECLNVKDSDQFNKWMHTDAGSASELFSLANVDGVIF